MAWLARDPERRQSPRSLWPEAQSVIVLGMNYGPDEDPLASLARRDRATISVYARHRDYHDLIKGRLKQLAGRLHRDLGAAVKVFVDTAPVLEKPLAQQAAIGWQGKHSNLVSRTFGSWLFLGEIFCDLRARAGPARGRSLRLLPGLPRRLPDRRLPGALPARCAALHLVPDDRAQGPHRRKNSARAIGNRIYGCDDCLAVCPWNKFARVASETKLQARDDLRAPALAELGRLDDAAFRARFAGSPIKRTGRDRFVRNVLIAIGNSGEPALAEIARERLADPSPLVRAMAVWALGRLLRAGRFRALRRTSTRRTSPTRRSPPSGGAHHEAVLLRARLHGAGAGAGACRPRAGRSPAPRAIRTSRPAWSATASRSARFARDRPLEQAERALAGTTHLLTSIAPDEAGDPVLGHHARDLLRCRSIAWAGYLGTTGVYGDRGGDWVTRRSGSADHAAHRRRARAEAHWLASGLPVHLFRLAGIYGPGPGRSALAAVRAGTRAPDRQARPGVLPHPRRRHRPGAARLDGAAQSRRDLQRRRRRAGAAAGRRHLRLRAAWASSRRPRSPFDTGRAVADGAQLLQRQPPHLQRADQGGAGRPPALSELSRGPARPARRGGLRLRAARALR